MTDIHLDKLATAWESTRLALPKAKQIVASVEFARNNILHARLLMQLTYEEFRAEYCRPDWPAEHVDAAWAQVTKRLHNDIATLRNTIAANARTLSELIGCLGVLLAMLPELTEDAPRAYRVIHEKTMENYEEIRAMFNKMAPPFDI